MARQLDLLRVYQVVLNRFGRPDEATVARLIARFDPHYPAQSRELNAELCQVLVYLQAPTPRPRRSRCSSRPRPRKSRSSMPQALRVLKAGWTPELQQTYFSWFPKAGQFKGGNSLRGFMANIKRDAVANLSEAEKAELKPILDAKPVDGPPPTARAAVRQELDARRAGAVVERALKGRDFDRGRALFAAAKCFCLPPLQRRRRRARARPLGRRRPVQRPRPARVDRPAQQDDQRPVRGGDDRHDRRPGRSPAGSSTCTATT